MKILGPDLGGVQLKLLVQLFFLTLLKNLEGESREALLRNKMSHGIIFLFPDLSQRNLRH